MAVKHTITLSYSRGTGSPVRVVSEITSEADEYVSLDVPVQSNYQIALAFVRARLKSILVKAGGPLTLKTNSTSAPDNTWALDADKPLIWNVDSLIAVNTMFAADVTTLYVTNAGADPVAIEIVLLLDATP
jgi:hypothetical protein